MGGVASKAVAGPTGLPADRQVEGSVLGSETTERVKNSSPAPHVDVQTAFGGVLDGELGSVREGSCVCVM